MNYNSLMNKPTINYRELIGDNAVNEVGGITEEQFNTLLNTDLSSYYTKAQIDDLFSRSYVYREKSGSIVTFDCPASTPAFVQILSNIVAVQSGSGDPSSSNIRPISGWSAVNVYDTGKNMFYMTNDNKFSGYLDNTKIVANANHACYYFPCKSNTTYTVSKIATATNGRLGIAYSYEVPSNNLPIYGTQILNSFVVGQRYSLTITTDASAKYIIVWAFWGSDEDSKDSIQLEFGSEPTTFTPYDHNSQTYTTTLKDGQGNPLTCYGGGLMNAGGSQALLVTKGHIASYNGETLPSTWISDRDVYAAGTTPTIGAEVVYELETPLQIPQDSLSIVSNGGINNIWCDSGDITVRALDKII